MSFTHHAMLRAAVLALPAMLFTASAQAGDQPKGQTSQTTQTQDEDRTMGFAPSEDAAPSGPALHRQPRAADIPSDLPRDPSDAWLDRLNRETDRKLQFCRHC